MARTARRCQFVITLEDDDERPATFKITVRGQVFKTMFDRAVARARRAAKARYGRRFEGYTPRVRTWKSYCGVGPLHLPRRFV